MMRKPPRLLPWAVMLFSLLGFGAALANIILNHSLKPIVVIVLLLMWALALTPVSTQWRFQSGPRALALLLILAMWIFWAVFFGVTVWFFPAMIVSSWWTIQSLASAQKDLG